MELGFSGVNVSNSEKVSYLNKAGLHKDAVLVSVSYDATETYEYIDIELDVQGNKFRDRTFIPTEDRVFLKKKWAGGKEVGEETKEEAFKRSIQEIVNKLFYLGAAYSSEEELKNTENAKSWKELIAKLNKIIDDSGNKDQKLNILTVWKNNDTKKTSNLIIPVNTKWVEASGETITIKLSKYQTDNLLVEKYPYVSNNAAPTGDSAINESTEDTTGDLPF